MKLVCSANDNCNFPANYRNTNGNCFCRKHCDPHDQNIVHIAWKECAVCKKTRRLVKNKCIACTKTCENVQSSSSTPTQNTVQIENDESKYVHSKNPDCDNKTVQPETPRSHSRMNVIRSSDISNKLSETCETNDKEMIRLLKSLSKHRSVELTVYRIKILPQIDEE